MPGYGHPDSEVRECLPASSLKRIYSYVDKWRRYSDLNAPSDLRFKHFKGLDFDELITLAGGRGVKKESIADFKWSLNEYSLWLAETGTKIPFDDAKMKALSKRMTPHELKEDRINNIAECGVMVLAKNKHHASLRKILSESNHPDAADILALWDESLGDGSETITLNPTFISWKESEGGYSIVDRKDGFRPVIDVFRRWDAKVLNHNVTIVQIKAAKSVMGSTFEAYLNLDSDPSLLTTLGFDFATNNETIIKALQDRMPVVERYEIHPSNTELLPSYAEKLLKLSSMNEKES